LGYFSDDETAMWSAYLNDLTPSPFFLLALRDGVEYNYMMKEEVSVLRKYYLQPEQLDNWCIIDAMYHEFWAGPVGDSETAHATPFKKL
jgi:hypothetical protein